MKRSASLLIAAPIIIGGGLIFVMFGAGRESSHNRPTDDIDTTYGAADVPLEVDHNAFNSTFLKPDVAKLYGIEVDEDVGVTVVSIYQKDSPGVGVQARVSGSTKNLMGQTTRLNFDEVREGQAAYHVATFRIVEDEQITFEVDVDIIQTGETRQVQWQQQFWPG